MKISKASATSVSAWLGRATCLTVLGLLGGIASAADKRTPPPELGTLTGQEAQAFAVANGDTFSYIGSRTTGRDVGHYAVVGPRWKGTLPAGVKRIDSEYDSLVIWGRIGVSGPEDVKNALAIQDALRLVPLSQFGKSDKQPPPDLKFSQQRVALTVPKDLPADLSFYFKLAESLQHTPPKKQDAVVAESLSWIGFKNGHTTFDYKSLNEAQRRGLAKAYQFALSVVGP